MEIVFGFIMLTAILILSVVGAWVTLTYISDVLEERLCWHEWLYHCKLTGASLYRCCKCQKYKVRRD